MSDQTSLASLSDELIIHVLKYIPPSSSARLGLTNKKWAKKILLHRYMLDDEEDDSCGGFFSIELWKFHAIKTWGCSLISILEHYGGEVDSNYGQWWYYYYRQRCSTSANILPKSTSHLSLIQEEFAYDPFHLLTSCILASRTSGGMTVRKVVQEFVTKYPTPTCIIEGDLTVMAKELHPLGLNRERTMKKFAEGYIQPWTNVTELHGCGAFAASSFTVFCRGDYKSVLKDKKADKNVKAYASYLKRKCEEEMIGKSSEDNTTTSGLNYNRKQVRERGRKRKSMQKERIAPVRRSTRNRENR